MSSRTAAVIGGGPAGLMAAEVLIGGGIAVQVYDSMPSMGRKLLQAGVGGLNLTHAEESEAFLGRYGARRAEVAHWLEAFGPEELRAWARGLGIETFVGSSGRVFPREMKAAPFLRAWLRRLREAGVSFYTRHRWTGWGDDGALSFETPEGGAEARVDATVLALGGGSWPQLGSDGAWVSLLAERGVEVAALKPANCGFDYTWSERFAARFAGTPVKPVIASFTSVDGIRLFRQGEFIVTSGGVEGGLIYALSAILREDIAAQGAALLYLDLLPDRTLRELEQALARPRGTQSMANHLRKRAGIEGVKAGLLRELAGREDYAEPKRLASVIKSLPLRLEATRPLSEAISSAGGVRFEALDGRGMLKALPGVFCAGEMLDWEAPTGGYLLTACFALGRAAGEGALSWLERSNVRV